MHMRKQRWACLVAHRRAGKTVACVAELIDAALRCKKPNPRFAYVAPFYTQAKDIAWTYVKEYGAKIPNATLNESELRLDLPNGARVRLYGAENYDRMRGIYLDGVVLDEPADFPPSAWTLVIRPTLSDRRGWAVFIGTPKGRNAFFDIWNLALDNPKDWYSLMLKASASGLVDEEELRDARKSMTPEQYEQEYECSFNAAILGAYFAREIAQAESENRIGAYPADPHLPVHTAWDLGIGDSTAIWLWQAAPDGLRVVDFIEDHGKALPFYAAQLAALKAARKYTYGIDFVPHDAKARELGTGRTRVETLLALGRKPQLAPMHTVDDGINATRVVLEKTYFNEDTTKDGVEALRQYRAEYDEKLKAFRSRPRHDWTSHPADGARYMALSYRDLVVHKVEETPKPKAGQVILQGPPEPRRGAKIRL
jgi:hypothetical protein